jgi:hypothetical protein
MKTMDAENNTSVLVTHCIFYPCFVGFVIVVVIMVIALGARAQWCTMDLSRSAKEKSE